MKKVAIIGASSNRKKFGNKAVRAYQKQGWQVYPVNLTEKEIEGLPVFKSVLDIPTELDRISIYLPAQVGLQVIEEIAKKMSKEVYFNPGSDSDELVAKAKELGINPVLACSIVDIGEQPINYT